MSISKNKKILVTGADGFIGSHLVNKLISLGHDVRAMTMYNSFNNWGWLDTFDKRLLRKIEVVSGDIRDKKFVTDSCKDIDVIFHLASLIAIPYSYKSPYSYVSTNIEGTLNILEAALNFEIENIVHTSTSEVYGESNTIAISEESKSIARSPYSATKIGADQLAYSYYSTFGLPVSTIRPFNTYGPRQSSRAIIPTIITQLLSDNYTIKLGSLDPTRDFCFVEDTVSGFLSVASNKKSIGEVINIGSGYEISIKDLVSMIGDIMDIKITIKSDKNRIRPKGGEVDRLRANINKAKKILKWEPGYKGKAGLKNGLEKTIEWFKDDENSKQYKTNIYNV
jgi:NAD dependent epimerase/dehydratase